MKKISNNQIEKRLSSLEQSVETIKTNHLPHIQAEMSTLNTKIDSITNHVSWIRNIYEVWEKKVDGIESKVEKIDGRVWYILSTVILGFLVSIALLYFKTGVGN